MVTKAPSLDSTRTLVDTLHRYYSLFPRQARLKSHLDFFVKNKEVLPSHWPPLSHNSRGVPSGHSQSRSREVLPPPHVAEQSDQHDHGEYSHFGGQASRLLFRQSNKKIN